MDQLNPYAAPQHSGRVANVPVAEYGLPPEMRIVADGLKFCLWSINIWVGAIILAFIGGIIVASQAVGNIPQANKMQEIQSSMVTLGLVVGAVVLVSYVFRVLGIQKCSQIPAETGARGNASVAYITAIASLALTVLLFLGALIGLFEQESRLVGGLQVVDYILTLVSIMSFALFLKKTARYMQDADLLSRATTFFNLLLIVAGLYTLVIIGVIGMALTISPTNPKGSNLFAIFGVFGFLLIILILWALVVYSRLLGKMRKAIDLATR